jgi:hypothetical protein
MSIRLVQPEVERFLADTESSVMVIAGKWGVGKTYAWNLYLEQAAAKGQFSANHYAYVSLFGLGNLEELKAAIFQNTIRKTDIGKPADLETLDGVVRSAPGLWRKAGTLGRMLPGADKYLSTFEKVGFFWVKKQIICIDDLERRSKSLDVRDVLGLISYLKEQRGCKVVLLLNDEKIEGDAGDEFATNLEKVADVTLRFEPTPEEAAAIGVDGDLPFYEQLRSNCASLGIVNIRTIKKIERMAKRLYAELKDFDARVFGQALHTLTLLEFAKLQPIEAPSLDYISKLNDFSIAFEEVFAEQAENLENPRPAEHTQWQALLSAYGFNQIDELDAVIFKAVREGHVDSDALKKEGLALEKRLKAADADQSFQQAWDLYHDSFNDNAKEVTAALAEAVKKTPDAISPTNLSGTVSVLKDLEWEGDVPALIAGYVEARAQEPKDFWDLPRSTFGGEVRDPDVREAFAKKLATFSEGRDPVAVLHEIAKERGWNPDDVAFLAGVSPDEFYAIFKRLQGKDLRRAIAGALWFRSIVNADEDMAKVTANAVAALQRIGQESKINRRRVTQRGVVVPDAEEQEPFVGNPEK